MHLKGLTHGNADALSCRPCGLECQQCCKHETIVKMVTTRRQAARRGGSVGKETAPEAEPTTPAHAAKNDQAVVEEPCSIEVQPETLLRTRRQRRRMRGRRHRLSRTSTDISDLVPDREWTPEYLAAMQQADIDLAEVRKWKLGVIEKPS